MRWRCHKAGQLFSLTPLEAAKKLQADFGIADVEFDKEQYKRECNTRMKQLLKEKQFESWKHNIYLLLTDYCSMLRKWREEYAPKALDEPIKEEYAESLQERLGKSKNYQQLMREIEVKQEELEELREVKPLRLYADDCSSEALTTLLSENDGMMAVISAEGSIFDIIAGRYNTKINMDVWLKGHSGDESRVDRKNRMTEYISNPRLTTVLAIQPSVLEEIMTNKTMTGRGLIARFLIAVPVSRIGQRIFVSDAIAPEVIEKFRTVLLKILTTVPNNTVQTLHLSKEAQAVIESDFNENEALLSDRTCSMREWLAKNVGAVLRIAGVLHLASDHDHNTLVSSDTMTKAVAIGRYFRNHARYAYSVMDGDDMVKKAEYVLEKLRCYQSQVVKRRKVFRDCRGKYFKAVDDLKPTLNLLEEYGYLRQQSIPVDGTNRPSEIIHISPYINL